MGKVLDGVRVLEMGTFITGPAAAMFLADMGADVVKLERPKTGDPFRAFNGGLYSPHFQTYNRNKRSLTLDTNSPADLKLLDELVRDADVFIQNFLSRRRGKFERRIRTIAGIESGADLLRNFRLRTCRTGSRSAGLRHSRAGRERLVASLDQP